MFEIGHPLFLAGHCGAAPRQGRHRGTAGQGAHVRYGKVGEVEIKKGLSEERPVYVGVVLLSYGASEIAL